MGKRDDKRPAEWRKAYTDKAKLLDDRGFSEVSPMDFYRDLFPVGSLQSDNDDKGKGNMIASRVRQSKRGRTRQFVVHDDLRLLNTVIGDEFGLIAPISFYGKTHSKKNAHELFAVAIDIDYVGLQQLKNLLKQFGNGVQLSPTYLVSSGKGVHLYYFLEKPIPLYHNLSSMLKNLKEDFTRRLWNDTSSLRPENPDLTGIYQNFRCVGSQSKMGKGYPVRAWRISGKRYTLDDIKNSIPGCTVDISIVDTYPPKPDPEANRKNRFRRQPKKVTALEAMILYPEWYQRKIVEGKANTYKWKSNPALYDWWKRKIRSEVKEGGRYFSIMALCSFGLKCGISEVQIRHDAYDLYDYLESITEDEDNHFSQHDIADALKALRNENKELTYLSTREWISKHTKVEIPPNKRNGRTREDHMRYLNGMRQLRKQLGEDEYGRSGRPSKDQIVAAWREAHPDGKKTECVRETGLSKPTVYKWWDGGKANLSGN